MSTSAAVQSAMDKAAYKCGPTEVRVLRSYIGTLLKVITLAEGQLTIVGKRAGYEGEHAKMVYDTAMADIYQELP